MKKATLEKLRARLGEYVTSSAKQPVLILRDGEPVAVLVGLVGGKKTAPIKLREVLKRAWRDYDEHGGFPHDQFWDAVARETGKSRKREAK